ncbi:MAG: acyl-ACP desaturase [Gemmataceae bacterium]
MSEPTYSDSPALVKAIYQEFRRHFAQAERKRRWSIDDDIPWDQCNPQLNPAVADVVESFCAVEMYLPDYTGKIMPWIRANRGRAWFTANWGYEEAKHSLSLGDWLLKSGQRTEEQMQDLEGEVFQHEWNLPMDDVRGMLVYSMTQELATWLNYRNLRQAVGPQGDPALYKLLGYIMVDERAHYDFFLRVARLHLEDDRAGTLEQLRRVLNNFAMPAIHMLADGRQRIANVKSLHIFDDEIFYKDVYLPILHDLGVSRAELRRKTAREVVVVSPPANP